MTPVLFAWHLLKHWYFFFPPANIFMHLCFVFWHYSFKICPHCAKKRALNNLLDSFRKWVQIKDWIVHLNLYLFDIKKNENSINMNKQSKQEDLSCYIKVSTDLKSKGSKLLKFKSHNLKKHGLLFYFQPWKKEATSSNMQLLVTSGWHCHNHQPAQCSGNVNTDKCVFK